MEPKPSRLRFVKNLHIMWCGLSKLLISHIFKQRKGIVQVESWFVYRLKSLGVGSDSTFKLVEFMHYQRCPKVAFYVYLNNVI